MRWDKSSWRFQDRTAEVPARAPPPLPLTQGTSLTLHSSVNLVRQIQPAQQNYGQRKKVRRRERAPEVSHQGVIHYLGSLVTTNSGVAFQLLLLLMQACSCECHSHDDRDSRRSVSPASREGSGVGTSRSAPRLNMGVATKQILSGIGHGVTQTGREGRGERVHLQGRMWQVASNHPNKTMFQSQVHTYMYIIMCCI